MYVNILLKTKLQKKETLHVVLITINFFQIDNHSTGQRPEVEVTFSNLDDHIDSAFLSNLVSEFIIIYL